MLLTPQNQCITYTTIDGGKHQREGQPQKQRFGDGIVPGFSATGYIGCSTGSEYSLQPCFPFERDLSPSKRGLILSMQGLADTDISLEFQLQGFLQQADGLGWYLKCPAL
jgi:hypothetical protein